MVEGQCPAAAVSFRLPRAQAGEGAWSRAVPLPRWRELHVVRLRRQEWSRSVLETVTDIFAEVGKI